MALRTGSAIRLERDGSGQRGVRPTLFPCWENPRLQPLGENLWNQSRRLDTQKGVHVIQNADLAAAEGARSGGEAPGFESFASARWADLVRAAFLMGASASDAEDHAQAALAIIWRKWDRVAAADEPDAYAFRILINTVRRARRRRWTGEQPAAEIRDPCADSGDDPGRHAVAIDLHRALGRLPVDQRAVLVLRYLLDKSEGEIASILEIPAGTVKSRSARGLANLRNHLDQEAQQ
jgi:RNA polymerase sigma-70 factor (sigma-E family)